MSRVRIVMVAVAFAVGLVGFQIQPAAAAETEVEGVMTFAKRQLNKPFRLGAEGLRRYDCSGLVYRTYLENGLLDRIGGSRKLARGYYRWFKRRGQLTRNPRVGDLVAWAKPGRRVSHIGIFKGYNRRGKPLALSALTSGVAVHKVHRINVPLKAYLDVKLN